MMRCLVNPQRPTLFFQPVPATEVIGAVTCIQVPVKINGSKFSSLTTSQQLIHFCTVWRVSVVECYDYLLSCFLLCFKNFLTFIFVGCHWFFGNNVGAEFHSTNDKFMVR